ncbi:hypothetical protein RRG08_033087, partial [Elysia crispata]
MIQIDIKVADLTKIRSLAGSRLRQGDSTNGCPQFQASYQAELSHM